jgi:Protein of unknown function (DUF2442)
MTIHRDSLRTITGVEAVAPASLRLTWSSGDRATIDLSRILKRPGFEKLSDPAVFARVRVGDWGHSVEWPNIVDLGADRLWLETLSALGKHDAREFLEWRLRHGLSLSKAAHMLGMSRRMIAYYSVGEKPVPKVVLLACSGWEHLQEHAAARRSDRSAAAEPLPA